MVMDFCLLSKQGNFTLHFSLSLHLTVLLTIEIPHNDLQHQYETN